MGYGLHDRFRYLDSSEPSIVYGCRVNRYCLDAPDDYGTPLSWTFKPGRVWKNIVHQYGGVACLQFYVIGTVLEPHKEVSKKIKELDEKWSNTDGNVTSFDNVISYRMDIIDLFGVDCNNSYRDFNEALYPIDMDPSRPGDTINRFSKAHDLHCWPHELLEKGTDSNGWGLWILGRNSD